MVAKSTWSGGTAETECTMAPSTLRGGKAAIPHAMQLGLILSGLALLTGSVSAETAYCSNVNTGADNKPSMSLFPSTTHLHGLG